MTWDLDTINALAADWLELGVAVLWQSTLIGLAIGLLAYRLPKSWPTARYWLWQLVAVKLLLMPFWVHAAPLPYWSVPRHDDTTVASATAPVAEQVVTSSGAGGSTMQPVMAAVTGSASPFDSPSFLPRVGWATWLLLAWLVVVMLQLARIAIQAVRLSQLLAVGKPADQPLTELTRQLAVRLGLANAPETLLVEADCPPFVCGVWRPRIVLGRSLATSLSDNQLRQVLLHELSHVRRRDLAWGWVFEAARMAYFFHPLIHWASHQMRLERELACDQMAITAAGNSVPDYASTLAKVAGGASSTTRRRLSVVG